MHHCVLHRVRDDHNGVLAATLVGHCVWDDPIPGRIRGVHPIVGMTNSAPSLTPVGQRDVTVLVLV